MTKRPRIENRLVTLRKYCGTDALRTEAGGSVKLPVPSVHMTNDRPNPKATHFDEQPRYQHSCSIIGADAERPRTLATQAYFEVCE